MVHAAIVERVDSLSTIFIPVARRPRRFPVLTPGWLFGTIALLFALLKSPKSFTSLYFDAAIYPQLSTASGTVLEVL